MSTELDKFANQSCMVNNNTAAFFCGGSASVPRGVVFAPVSLTTVSAFAPGCNEVEHDVTDYQGPTLTSDCGDDQPWMYVLHKY